MLGGLLLCLLLIRVTAFEIPRWKHRIFLNKKVGFVIPLKIVHFVNIIFFLPMTVFFENFILEVTIRSTKSTAWCGRYQNDVITRLASSLHRLFVCFESEGTHCVFQVGDYSDEAQFMYRNLTDALSRYDYESWDRVVQQRVSMSSRLESLVLRGLTEWRSSADFCFDIKINAAKNCKNNFFWMFEIV